MVAQHPGNVGEDGQVVPAGAETDLEEDVKPFDRNEHGAEIEPGLDQGDTLLHSRQL